MVGAPGAGKGTQAALLSERLGIPHVASGDLFRDNIKRGTPLGKKVKQYLDAGALVPDDLTITMIARPAGRVRCARGRHPRRLPAHSPAGRGARPDARTSGAAASPRRCTSTSTATSSSAGCPAAGCAPSRPTTSTTQVAKPPKTVGRVRYRRRPALPARRRQARDDQRPARAAAAADVRGGRLLRRQRRAQHGRGRPAHRRGHRGADARDRAVQPGARVGERQRSQAQSQRRPP